MLLLVLALVSVYIGYIALADDNNCKFSTVVISSSDVVLLLLVFAVLHLT